MNLGEALQKAVGSCAQPYYKHKRRLERESRPPRDYSYFSRPARVTLEERLFRLFPEGYSLASDNEAFTPMVRQLYYVMRRLLQEDGCHDSLSDAYHRTILEKYEQEVGRRLCHRKAVGDMIEPHSTCPTCGTPQGCSLGTTGVEHYDVPKHRFNKIIYVEKTGFMQQLLDANIHSRFDVAIAAGAGFSPQAAKELFAKIEREIQVTVYVLHDADIAGLEIARSLGKRLVHENYHVTVEDLGLRPKEAIELGLPSETVEITAEPSWGLKHSVSKKELKWLLGDDVGETQHYKKNRKVRYVGERVELNAFTPKAFIAWVEGKLQNVAGKIIPEKKIVLEAVVQKYQETLRSHVAEALLSQFELDTFVSSLPCFTGPTVTQIRKQLKASPEQSWQDIIEEKVREEMQELDLFQRIQALLKERR